LVCEKRLWKPAGMKCVKISTLKIGWIYFPQNFETPAQVSWTWISIFQKEPGWIWHALLKPIPGNSQNNQRTTQHWKRPNWKKPPKERIHTCWDHRSLCLYGLLWHHPVDAPLKLLKILLYILTDQSTCSVQGEEFQTHPQRINIEMELCCCTVASSCYTLFVCNNTYCFFLLVA
jgi:hypothetical protein